MVNEYIRFQSQYSHKPYDGEVISSKSIVDPSGYVDAQTRIENLMRAGERLDEYRRDMYQYGPDDDYDDDSSDDPTMEPGYDLADAHYQKQKALSRLRRSMESPSKKPIEPVATNVVDEAKASEVKDGEIS